MAHVYFHIDLNAFFVSAECILDPSLKGKPVAVCGQTRRSVVATASYEARKYGVHSAMPVSEARHLCPDLIMVEPHFQWYRSLSEEFMNIVYSITPEVEQASIDECYADMTVPIQAYAKPLDLAWNLQRRILRELQLPCSIGIGERTRPYMEDLGIQTIGDLANYSDKRSLEAVFGKNTDKMIARANGYDDRVIVKETDAKSMGVSETLLEDVTDEDEIRGLFRTLSRKLAKRLEAEHKAGSLLSIRIKYYDFSNADRSRKLSAPVWKAEDLYEQAMGLFEENWAGEPVRLLGLSVSDFAGASWAAQQMNLFDPVEEAHEETSSILQELNHQLTLGGHLVRASSLLKNGE